MFYLLLAKIIAVTDLFLKFAIEQIPQEKFPRYLKGTKGCIKIHCARNEGLPFGKFSGHFLATKVFPLLMLVFCGFRLLFLVLKKRFASQGSTMEKLGLSFVVGGGLSNVAERMKKGYVVDYFSFPRFGSGKFKDTIFNIGDLFIILGSLLLFIQAIVKEEK